MRGKKKTFGFLSGLAKIEKRTKSDWFDVSTFLVRGQETLEDEQPTKPNYTFAYVLIIGVMLLFGWRLMKVQITEGSENRYLAQGNSLRQQVTIAPRGLVVDDKGNSLITNDANYQFSLIPADLPLSESDRDKVLHDVASWQKISYDSLAKKVAQAGLTSLDPLVLDPHLPRDTALIDKVKFDATPGVQIDYVPSRQYATTPGLAQILGYTSQMTGEDEQHHPDYPAGSPIGRTGLESSYDTVLRGQPGINDIEVNASGQFQRYLQQTPPVQGDTLHLTLDQGLQNTMVTALQAVMAQEKVNDAVGVAIDPKTGGILASVSLPSYDDNLFAKGISSSDYASLANNPDKPLLDRATQGQYPSGSTIKPVVAAAALQEGTITKDTTLDTSAGAITIGPYRFPDWKVHGVTNVGLAIAQSNDVFFSALGGGWKNIPALGIDRLAKYFNAFGLGQETGVDYSNDQSGLVPTPAWRKSATGQDWFIGDTYHVSIGQGDLLVTPLQMVRAIAAIANDGTLVTPHVVASEESPATGQIKQLTYPTQKVPVSSANLQTVRDGMRLTVTGGSAQILKNLPFTSAGKTGTAEFGTDNKTHAWYVGYAPYEDPQIVVAVLVEGGGEGNAISAPVAGQVFSYYLSHK